jgi:hypothetical protein
MRVMGASTVGRPDLGQGIHGAFARVVGEDDQVGLGRAFAAHLVGLALQHGVDADAGPARMPVILASTPASSATRRRR